MYIEPNTNIRLLQGCPCDPDYVNTLYFENKNTQSQYFVGLTKYNLTNYTYQRVNKGVLRVGIIAENLYNCNYMMFQNTSFGSKWFYAFINKVEYVNDTMSEVYFTIDAMQTWLLDYSVDYCFVEREHSLTDTIGSNLVPENLNLGEYIIEDIEQPTGWNTLGKCIVVGSTDWWDGDPSSPTWHEGTGAGEVGGVFCGVHFKVFKGGNETGRINDASQYVQKFAEEGKTESILGVWETYEEYVTIQGYNASIKTQRGVTLNGYAPKNKKLLTFPYCFLEASTGEGGRHTYMYEYFTNPADITFNIRGSFNGTASLGMYPTNYKGATPNYDEMIGYDSASVQCAYTTDSFKAWLAQNSYNMHTRNGDLLQLPKNAIGSMSGGLMPGALIGSAFGPAGTVVGGLIGMGIGGIKTVTDIMQKQGVTPNTGSLGSGSAVNHLLKNDTFKIYRKAIRPEFAQKIDQFFDRYGYATNNIKRPNTHSRPHWNYVKTVDCSITGSIPADDRKIICSVYDKGVTFWKNGTEVGNYSLNNSPT